MASRQRALVNWSKIGSGHEQADSPEALRGADPICRPLVSERLRLDAEVSVEAPVGRHPRHCSSISSDRDEFPHFLGAIVLKQLDVQPGQPPTYLVVDGQQRLTTLQLALAGIRDALTADATREISHSGSLFHIEQLIRNPLPPGQMGLESKIVPFDDTDIRAFDAVMAARRPPDASHPMVKCRDYFRIQTASILGQDESPEDIRDLIHAACNLLRIVSITLGEGDSEHLIFETLNARAVPLSEWEKARNLFLAEASDTYSKAEETRFYESYLKTMDEDLWWRGWVSAQRQWIRRSGAFFRSWLEVEHGRTIPPDRAYYWFRRLVRERDQSGQRRLVRGRKQSEPPILDIGASFRHFATLFREIEEKCADPRSVEGRFFYRRKVLNFGVGVPFLMKLFDLLEPGHARNRCIRALESWLVRRMLVGWNTRGYDRVFIRLVKRLNAVRADDPSGVVSETMDGLQDTHSWPDDRTVRVAVVSMPKYPGYHSAARIRMILEAIETHLIEESGMVESMEAPRKLWIEHVMPQSWQRHWPVAGGVDGEVENREQALRRLGNLTLTNSKLDITLSNRPWSEKRRLFNEHTTLFLNRELLDLSGQREWDESTIERRGDRMADHIIKIWPHADAI